MESRLSLNKTSIPNPFWSKWSNSNQKRTSTTLSWAMDFSWSKHSQSIRPSCNQVFTVINEETDLNAIIAVKRHMMANKVVGIL